MVLVSGGPGAAVSFIEDTPAGERIIADWLTGYLQVGVHPRCPPRVDPLFRDDAPDHASPAWIASHHDADAAIGVGEHSPRTRPGWRSVIWRTAPGYGRRSSDPGSNHPAAERNVMFDLQSASFWSRVGVRGSPRNRVRVRLAVPMWPSPPFVDRHRHGIAELDDLGSGKVLGVQAESLRPMSCPTSRRPVRETFGGNRLVCANAASSPMRRWPR